MAVSRERDTVTQGGVSCLTLYSSVTPVRGTCSPNRTTRTVQRCWLRNSALLPSDLPNSEQKAHPRAERPITPA